MIQYLVRFTAHMNKLGKSTGLPDMLYQDYPGVQTNTADDLAVFINQKLLVFTKMNGMVVYKNPTEILDKNSEKIFVPLHNIGYISVESKMITPLPVPSTVDKLPKLDAPENGGLLIQ